MGTPISRRQFWRMPLGEAARTVLKGKQSQPQPAFIRPPGAVEETEFLDRCLRCAACVAACPHDAVFEAGPETGRAEATPMLVPEKTPCRWCSTWDCINVCESGALEMPLTGNPAPIAKAEINLDRCLVAQGILCDECIVTCPPDIRAIGRDGRFPKLDPEACTGCGLCAHFCQAEPAAISVRPLGAAQA